MYFILGSNNVGGVTLYGTSTGKPYLSEGSANIMRAKLAKRWPQFDFLVIDITECPLNPDGSRRLECA
jgi:hypothetical protein